MEPSDESLALLSRLSSKPGVQSTLVLSRADGAIIRSEGLLARNKKQLDSTDGATAHVNGSNRDSTGLGIGGVNDPADVSNTKTGADIARAVWKYVQATEGLVEDMDTEDELRLLRVRTKKNELVVVPSKAPIRPLIQ
jgi:dynein light chain roadblock-type